MRSRILLLIVFCALSSFAGAQTSSGQGATSSQPAATPQRPMHTHPPEPMQSMCKEMMQRHLDELKSMGQALNSNLAQMKSTLPMISDLNERNRWQANIAMWQAVADHFQGMAGHMEHMQSMGMGCGMMGAGMGHHGEHKGGPPSTPPPAESKPK